MKFWKLSLLTALVFSCLAVVITHSSCERNVCDNVTCFNGGSCQSGKCHCPIGWEDPQCQTQSTSRYIGMYVGSTICNAGARLIDTAWITQDPVVINYVYLTYKTMPSPMTPLHGYVNNNEATYSIIIPNDSMANYLKVYTVTLQGDKTLTINTYEHDTRHVGDTIINSCNFTGSKQ
jgi:hypothetical protein